MSKNIFNSVKQTREKKNVFDLSHDVKLSCNMGDLVPTLALECIPGDKFNLTCESLARLAPMVAPMMHRVDVSMHYFFVPSRILWKKWSDFITNTRDINGDLPAFPTLFVQFNNYTKLHDYLGIPNPPNPTPQPETINALPFAAYQMIYNEYYRDQNLIDPVPFELGDGDNTSNTNLTVIRKRAWQHDYFTASLPFAQKGAAVSLPIAGFQDVPVFAADHGQGDPSQLALTNDNITVDGSIVVPTVSPAPVGSELFAETSALVPTESTINDLRKAYRLQEWLEKAARGGTRLVEAIWSFFGVKSPDSRLQRPEYITGTKSPIIISEVLNTTGTDDAPQGNMAGHGIGITSGKYGNYFVQEHGYIIGIMSIMPKTAYQQGISRMFRKHVDPFEFFFPQFANIGEQEVTNGEVYAYTGTTNDTFGYVPRYAEYKFEQNRVCGEFRTSLDFWHMGRIFANPPALNKAFIEADPTTRVFAVTDTAVDHLYVQVLHKIRAVRGMPKFGTPTF